MPLIDADAPPSQTDGTHYVVYFASGEPSWCPDCRDALPTLQRVFGPASAPSAYIVRVERADWKGLSGQPCRYRGEPYNIQSVPTVVKLVNVGPFLSESLDDSDVLEHALIVKQGREIGRRGDDRQSEEDLRGLILASDSE